MDLSLSKLQDIVKDRKTRQAAVHGVEKYWSFSISPSTEYSGLISFKIDWFDLLAVQGPLDCKEIQTVHPKGDQS